MSKEIIKTKCLFVDDEGKGIIKHNGREHKVSYLLTGEEAEIELSRNGRFTDTKVLKVISPSKNRTKAPCKHYYKCGGCQLQHMTKKAHDEFKLSIVKKHLGKFASIEGLVAMDEPFNYRNKSTTTFKPDKRGNVLSGFYEQYTHKVVSIEKCIIQDERIDKIIGTIKTLMKSFKMQPFNEDNGQGFLRHVLVRTGFSSGQVMVVLVSGPHMFPSKNNFVKALLKDHPEITTIVHNINSKNTSMVLGDKEHILHGKGFIEDTLDEFVFQISPKSFYQINPVQTEKLYAKALAMANLNGNETVLDAYCGIGTISLRASKNAEHIIGVELNKDAVKDAIKNARRNKVQNARFFEDDAGDFMIKLARDGQGMDVVIMDPPRSGSDEKFLSSLVHAKPKKVVYVSCNPGSQARDLEFLTKNGYKVDKVVGVDMFPWTFHVESIAVLSKK